MTVCLGIGYDGRADVRQTAAQAMRACDYDPRAERLSQRGTGQAGGDGKWPLNSSVRAGPEAFDGSIP